MAHFVACIPVTPNETLPIMCETLNCIPQYLKELTKDPNLTLVKYITSVMIPDLEKNMVNGSKVFVDYLVKRPNIDFLHKVVEMSSAPYDLYADDLREICSYQGLGDSFNFALPQNHKMVTNAQDSVAFETCREVNLEVAALLTYWSTHQLILALIANNETMRSYFEPRDPVYKKLVTYFQDDRRGHVLLNSVFTRGDSKIFLSVLAAYCRWHSLNNNLFFETELVQRLLSLIIMLDEIEPGTVLPYDALNLSKMPLDDTIFEQKLSQIGITSFKDNGTYFFAVKERSRTIKIGDSDVRYSESLLPFIKHILSTGKSDAEVQIAIQAMLKNDTKKLSDLFTLVKISKLRIFNNYLRVFSDEGLQIILLI